MGESVVARERYERLTPGSRARFEESLRHLPDGVSRSSLVFSPHPTFIERGEGAHVVDVDGRSILDFGNANRSLLLGHSHPDVIAALGDQLGKGLTFTLMNDREVELAKLIKEQCPSMERLRFTSSGTEATMFAVRTARAHTGRTRFARFEASYHGTHDMMCVGAFHAAPLAQPGTEDKPVGWGIPRHLADDVEFLPFNDLDRCEQILAANAGQLAALIVEPVMGGAGSLPAAPGFLAGLRELCDRDGIVLIFDEMVSMGIGIGGGQAHYGVEPDLTTAGKVIGASMPMGCFGGRADIMANCERHDGRARVSHTGSFNAHPLAMAAGAAQLRALTPEVHQHLEDLGTYTRGALRALAGRRGIPMQVTGIHHLIGIIFTDRPVHTPADTQGADHELAREVELSLLGQGFYFPECRRGCVSAPMTTADIDAFVVALDQAFDEVGA